MKVQTKSILLLIILSALFVSGMYFFQAFEDKRMRFMFLVDNEEKNDTFDNIVKLKGSPLEILAYDYTYWDEMVNFLHNNNMLWAKSNMEEVVLKTYQADAIWVYKLNSTQAYSIRNRDAADLKELPLSGGAISDIFSKKRFCHFFVKTKAGLMEIRGSTIHPSLDAARITPPQGYFFAGRLWNEKYIGELTKLIKGQIRISAIKQALPHFETLLESNAIIFSRQLPGWQGKPAAYIYVSILSKELENYKLFSRNMSAIFIGFLISVLIFVIIFLTISVSVPLSIISQALRAQKSVDLSALEKDTGEFGDISRMISRFFTQKQELLKEITERKKLEAALMEKEGQNKILIASIPQRIFYKDLNSAYVLCNDNYARDLGITSSEIKGKTDFDFHPKELAEKYRIDDKRILQSGKPEELEEEYILGGKKTIIQITKVPMKDEQGNIIGLFGIFWDITDRKKIEQQEKLLLEDLEGVNRIMVGRELRMIELKNEVNRLSQKLGKPAPYSEASLKKDV